MADNALFNEDGMFLAPSPLPDLRGVPADNQAMYERSHGRYVLTDKGRELRDWALGEMARVKSEIQQVTVRGEAALAAERKATHDSAVARSISAALAQKGVKAGLHAGAAALLMASHTFEVEGADNGDGKVVLARTAFGLFSVETIVDDFLATDEGAAFRGKLAEPKDTYFADLMKGLKQRR